MWRPEPRLQRKLLAWLLGPLAILLVLDSAAAYWQSLRLSNLAYDRALYEVAREIVLHVKLDGDKPRLEMSEAAANVLLLDQEDQLFYRVVSEGGLPLGGNADMPAPKVDKAANTTNHVALKELLRQNEPTLQEHLESARRIKHLLTPQP